MASAQALIPLLAKAFLARAEAALDTILPFLFLTSLSLVMPPCVFFFEPRKTAALAMLLTRFAFMAFMAFIVVVFMALADFMAFAAFVAFIAAALFMGSAIAA